MLVYQTIYGRKWGLNPVLEGMFDWSAIKAGRQEQR